MLTWRAIRVREDQRWAILAVSRDGYEPDRKDAHAGKEVSALRSDSSEALAGDGQSSNGDGVGSDLVEEKD